MTDDTLPLPPELPDPARFTLNTYVVAGQVYQRKQDADGRWYWVAIHPRRCVRRRVHTIMIEGTL